MSSYRSNLPTRTGRLFLTDGGMETTLIFHHGVDLPSFATFDLLRRPEGPGLLRDYFRPYGDIARRFGAGLQLDTPTWRANADWGATLGYDAAGLREAHHRAVALLEEVRKELETAQTPVILAGCIGPRGDGYTSEGTMTAEEAEAYHGPQVETLAESSVDLASAMTLTHADEAVGIARAARHAELPVVISFTVETDGRLPSGEELPAAIASVDAATGDYPESYMINCAYPTHFERVLQDPGAWRERLRGLRANASAMSHAELDEAPELDAGDPVELGNQYARILERLPRLNILGGCCGTDARHVERIAASCSPHFRTAP